MSGVSSPLLRAAACRPASLPDPHVGQLPERAQGRQLVYTFWCPASRSDDMFWGQMLEEFPDFAVYKDAQGRCQKWVLVGPHGLPARAGATDSTACCGVVLLGGVCFGDMPRRLLALCVHSCSAQRRQSAHAAGAQPTHTTPGALSATPRGAALNAASQRSRLGPQCWTRRLAGGACRQPVRTSKAVSCA